MRSVVLYILLVGTPLLGLFGILRAGERIVPPLSVGGDWAFTYAPSGEAPPSCLAFRDGDRSGRMDISQSGTRAEIVIGTRPSLRISAEVRGDSLLGTARPQAVSFCEGLVRMRARFQNGEGNATLLGTLSTGGCATCSSAAFSAHRVSSSCPSC